MGPVMPDYPNSMCPSVTLSLVWTTHAQFIKRSVFNTRRSTHPYLMTLFLAVALCITTPTLAGIVSEIDAMSRGCIEICAIVDLLTQNLDCSGSWRYAVLSIDYLYSVLSISTRGSCISLSKHQMSNRWYTHKVTLQPAVLCIPSKPKPLFSFRQSKAIYQAVMSEPWGHSWCLLPSLDADVVAFCTI